MFLNVLFIFSALLTLGGAVLVLTLRNIVHACLALLASFLGVAGLYLSMGADFVGVVQIMVYVGGVVILMLFAIMITGGKDFVSKTQKLLGLPPIMGNKWTYSIAAMTVVVLTLAVGRLICRIAEITPAGKDAAFHSTVSEIGRLFVGKHVLAFEISSVLLLGALVGAAIISRPRKTYMDKKESTGEVARD